MSDVFEELRALAKGCSDHYERVVELEPAIIESLENTGIQYPALEIGNREGGSALLILAHIYKEGKQRQLITVDVGDSPGIVVKWAEKLAIPTRHYKMEQVKFVSGLDRQIGFAYFDADHNEESVTKDISSIIPHLVKGCMLAVDDVQEWKHLPEFPELERVEYNVDEGGTNFNSGHHFIAYRRK